MVIFKFLRDLLDYLKLVIFNGKKNLYVNFVYYVIMKIKIFGSVCMSHRLSDECQSN